jgi:hypothetical protein
MSAFLLEDVFKVGFFDAEMIAGVETLLQDLSAQCKSRLAEEEKALSFGGFSNSFGGLGDLSFLKQQSIITVPEKLLLTGRKNPLTHSTTECEFFVPLLKYYLSICDMSTSESLDSFFTLCTILLGKIPTARETVFYGPFQSTSFKQAQYTSLAWNQRVLDRVVEILQMVFDLNLNRTTSKEIILRIQSLAYNEDLYQSVLSTRAMALRFEEQDRFVIN